MSTPDWRLEGCIARPVMDGLRASLDLSQPFYGLRIETGPSNQPVAGILGLELDGPTSVVAEPVDCYVRQRDLVVTYAETPQRPLRVEVCWRAATFASPQGWLPMFDLLISVQTSLLGVLPLLIARTTANTNQVLRWSPERSICEAVTLPWTDVRSTAGTAPGCWVLPKLTFEKPSGNRQNAGGQADSAPQSPHNKPVPNGLRIATDCAYAELIHPADFYRGEIATNMDGQIVLRHGFFADTLEKGVILRARVRGLLLPTDSPTSTIAACHREFLALPPPLTA